MVLSVLKEKDLFYIVFLLIGFQPTMKVKPISCTAKKLPQMA